MATRRLVCIGLTALAMASPALADDKAPLDGTWGGAQDGVTAQVIVTGGQVIGFFWRGDYLDGTDARLSADGTALTFAFQGGTATLTVWHPFQKGPNNQISRTITLPKQGDAKETVVVDLRAR